VEYKIFESSEKVSKKSLSLYLNSTTHIHFPIGIINSHVNPATHIHSSIQS
jgi:hypothetical protein